MFHTLVVIARRVTHRRAFLPSPALFRRLPASHFLLFVLSLALAPFVPAAVRSGATGIGTAPETLPAALQQPQGGWSGGAGQPGDVPQPVAPALPASSANEAPPLPDWPLVVWDDFNDPAMVWFRGAPDEPVQGVHDNGVLRIQFEMEAAARRSLFSVHQFGDFRVDVDVQCMGDDPDVFAALFLRYSSAYDERSFYYSWQIHGDGSYVVIKRDGTSATTLWQAGPSACILTGMNAVNHLTAIAQGTRLDFYANGCYLASVVDDRFSGGDIGVAGGRHTTGGTADVRFDNFRVYASEPLGPVRFGEVRASLLSRDELLERGELIAEQWPYPADPVEQFAGGTKRVELYVPFEGITSGHQLSETAWIDGQEVWREGPAPWGSKVIEHGHLGFGVFMRTFQMLHGSDLPSGHWEIRMYVDGTLVARQFFSIGAEGSAPPPEAVEVGSAAALPPPALPAADASFQQVAELYSQGRFAEALEPGARTLAIAPGSTQLMVESAKVYEAAGKPEWARMLRAMADNLANQRVDTQQVGMSSVPLQPVEAGTGLTPVAVVETPRADAEALFGHVVDLYGQGRYAEAIPYCEDAMVAAPHAAQLPAECAKVYEAAGQPDYAAILRERAQALAAGGAAMAPPVVLVQPAEPLQPEVLPAETVVAPPVVLVQPTEPLQSEAGQGAESECLRKAREADERRDFQTLFATVDACLSAGAGADEIELTYYLGRACYFLGYADRDGALLARASAAFESVLAHNPAAGDAYDHLGRVRYYQNDPDAAWAYLSQAVTLDPTLPSPYLFFGRILYERKDYENAIPQFRAYLDHGGTASEAYAYTYIGWSAYKLKRYGPAEEAFLQAVALSTTDSNPYGGLAWVYQETDRCAEAIPLFQKAIELDPAFDGWQKGLAKCQP